MVQSLNVVRIFFILLSLMSVASCASPATLEGMTVPAKPVTAIPPQLNHSVKVGTVLGGESTNPLWTSDVGNREFREALEASLRNQNMLVSAGTGQKEYVVDATLIDVNQPLVGFSMSVDRAILCSFN